MDKIRIRMLENVRPDFPFGVVGGVKPGTILRVGIEYDAVANQHGAISGICESGEQLGVKPGEFEFVEAPEWVLEIWRKDGFIQPVEAPTVESFKQHLEESGLLTQLKAIAEEIEAKKMVPMGKFLKVLEEHGEYCEQCEADEPTLYYDPTGSTGPTVRCPYCGYSLKMDTLIKRARHLPNDYSERMITSAARETQMELIGEDEWITDGHLAEIAGDRRYSYPDRDKFKKTTSISKTLNSLAIDEYEEAKLSRTVYRPHYSYGPYIAALKSQNRTVYINNEFVQHMNGIYKPFIRGPLEPVLVKAHGKIRRIVLPMRFDPCDRGGIEG